MKKTIYAAFCGLLMTSFSYGQEPSSSDVLFELGKISDQYGANFNTNDVEGKITLIFVEGTNTAFTEIYSKFKYKRLSKNARIIAGWKNVMPDTESGSKFKHMTDGFKSNEGLGDDAYSVLFDINSETLEMLNLKQYSIVTIYKEENKMDIKDFGSNRIEFLKAIRKFFI